MQPSRLETELSHMRARDRRMAGLDGLAFFNDTAIRFIRDHREPGSAVGWTLSLLKLATHLHEGSASATQSVRRLVDGSSARTFLHHRHGTRFIHRIERAVSEDAEVINPWMRDAARHTVALAQATELLDQVNGSDDPHSWPMTIFTGTETSQGRWLLDQTTRSRRQADTVESAALDAMEPCIDDLNAALRAVDLERKRRGAHQAIRSRNDDRISQAANSGVELLKRLGELTDAPLPSTPRRDAHEQLRHHATAHRSHRLSTTSDGRPVDVALSDALTAARRLRKLLNRYKHGDAGTDAEALAVLRCLVALDAVLIVLTGIIQIRRDDPQLRWALSIDLDEIEEFGHTLTGLLPPAPAA